MIPTFRSMIVAMLLTLIALVGGFGLFAAFRVNHEPLARLPASTTPFALANNDVPPQALSFASEPPFGSRLESNAALVAISTVSMAGHNADPAETSQPPSVAAAPDSAAADNTPATTAAVDAKTDDAPPPAASVADPKADDASPPPATVAEADPKADDAVPPVAAVKPQSDAASVEPPQSDSTATPQTAAVESPSDQKPSEQASSDAAVVTAPAAESSQPETTPSATAPTDKASTAAPAPVITAAVTAARANEQDTAKEMARRKRLAAARRARRARALAAQLASQNSLFPQASFQSTSQITYPPAQQQAVGGPFVPAPAAASAKARRQN
jgi:hypothetical protein